MGVADSTAKFAQPIDPILVGDLVNLSRPASCSSWLESHFSIENTRAFVIEGFCSSINLETVRDDASHGSVMAEMI